MTEPVSATAKAISKIIETLEKWSGRRSIRDQGEAHADAKIADAKADAVALSIREAERRHNELLDVVHNEGISRIQDAFARKDDHEVAKLLGFLSGDDSDFKLLEARSNSRERYQQVKHQLNAENVTLEAARILTDEPNVSDEPVNEDWVNRFYDDLRFVSEEEMQLFWAKVLAGEVKCPGSFSRRTLEVLRNLSKQEARIFEAWSKYIISSEDGYSRFIVRTPVIFNSFFRLQGGYLNKLRDAGLLLESEGVVRITNDTKYLICGSKTINFTIPKDKEIHLEVWNLTTAGRELYPLLDVSTDERYLQTVAKNLMLYPTLDK